MTFLQTHTALQCDDLIRTEELATLLNHDALVWSEKISGKRLLIAFLHRFIRQTEALQWMCYQRLDTGSDEDEDTFAMRVMEQLADIGTTDMALCEEFPELAALRTPLESQGQNIPALLRYMQYRLTTEPLTVAETNAMLLRAIGHVFWVVKNTQNTLQLEEARINIVWRHRKAEFGPVEPRLVSFIALPNGAQLLPQWQARYPTVRATFLNPANAISRHRAVA